MVRYDFLRNLYGGLCVGSRVPAIFYFLFLSATSLGQARTTVRAPRVRSWNVWGVWGAHAARGRLARVQRRPFGAVAGRHDRLCSLFVRTVARLRFVPHQGKKFACVLL